METKERIRTLIKPKLILLLSGKRKSGKDFVERLLLERFPNSILSFRISSPIKKEFARERNLDYEELLTSSSYKENYRHKMVEWSESVRRTDPNYFLRLAIIEAYEKINGSERKIWLLNDARRFCDLKYFSDPTEINLDGDCEVITIRITANDAVRKQRGWIFDDKIDTKPTECGLDSYQSWTYQIHNDTNTIDELQIQLQSVFDRIEKIV